MTRSRCYFCEAQDYKICITGPNDLTICESCVYEMMAQLDQHQEINQSCKYRYYWQAILDDGMILGQHNGDTERSIMEVPLERCKEIRLTPVLRPLPTVRLLLKPENGERGFRCLQITQSATDGKLAQVREVLSLEKDGVKFYAMFDVDGTVTLSTSTNC